MESYPKAQEVLQETIGVDTSASQLRNVTGEIGEELREEQDEKTAEYWSKPLSERRKTKPANRLRLASVSIDGGRIQTRSANGSRGVHDPRWRETKNALFQRLYCLEFSEDPCSDLPACFTSQEFLSALLGGDTQTEASNDADEPVQKDDLKSWRPKVLFRTCLSSLRNSEEFGRMMEAHADSRGFYQAEKKAFVSDGLSYNWKIHEKHFWDFTPILDLIHALEHIYRAAKAIHACSKECWAAYAEWANLVWKGRVIEVIARLQCHLEELGPVPDDAEENHPSAVVASEIGYLENNAARMKYPEYRVQGLPITSSHMESYVKQLGRRVKASDKFWNDDESVENMLCLKAAMLSDDKRYLKHMHNRPGRPFNRNIRGGQPLSTAG